MPKQKVVRVRDLPDQIGTNGPRALLLCEQCGAEYSANAGDYWNSPKDEVLRCHGRPVRLVTKYTVYRDVR